jgi:murein DD-endopeptidase MepM/ murein hydrolase activator NlpD
MGEKQIIIIMLILLSPSHLLKMDRSGILYLIPQSKLEVGELVYAPYTEDKELRLNHHKFERIPNTQNSFAIVGLTTSLTVSVNQFSTKTKYHFFQPSREWLSQKLVISRPPLENANDLRLPAAVWQKVNDKMQARKDRDTMAKILSTEDNSNDAFSCMRSPLRSQKVSNFASPRTLPNGRAYYHAGVDLRAFSPTPLFAMGAGKVVFAEFMMTPGNMVVISHGHGLFSRYMHLSDIKVKAGDTVKVGQNIGLTGSTGRVEAPHLHWEVIWKGNHANPENFLLQWERICGRS